MLIDSPVNTDSNKIEQLKSFFGNIQSKTPKQDLKKKTSEETKIAIKNLESLANFDMDFESMIEPAKQTYMPIPNEKSQPQDVIDTKFNSPQHPNPSQPVSQPADAFQSQPKIHPFSPIAKKDLRNMMPNGVLPSSPKDFKSFVNNLNQAEDEKSVDNSKKNLPIKCIINKPPYAEIIDNILKITSIMEINLSKIQNAKLPAARGKKRKYKN